MSYPLEVQISRLNKLPLRSKLLLLFLPLLVVSVLLTLLFIRANTRRQMEQEAHYQLGDALHRVSFLVNAKLMDCLEVFMSMENSSAFKSLLLAKYANPEAATDYQSIIDINRIFDDTYQKHFQMIDSIYLKINEGEFSLMRRQIPTLSSVDVRRYAQRLGYGSGSYYWQSLHQDPVFIGAAGREVLSLAKIYGAPDSRLSGLFLLNIRSEYIASELTDYYLSPNGYLALVSADAVLSSCSMDSPYALGNEATAFLRANAGKSGSFDLVTPAAKSLYVSFASLTATEWVVAAVVPQNEIAVSAGSMEYTNLLFVCALLALTGFAAVVSADSVSRSIRFLSRQVYKLEGGDFDVSFRIKEENEVGVLANELERLVARIKTLLRNVEEEQKLKRIMELAALQEQIKPHFIYNTLSSIMFLIDLGENQKASRMTLTLIRFLKTSISGGDQMITLREELEHVESYLILQNMRANGAFSYEIDVAEGLAECRIVKLTLQPLVENAIQHGFERSPQAGRIRITARREGDDAVIELRDNGCGIQPDTLAKIRKAMAAGESDDGEAYGLWNVDRRLRLSYGKPYGLRIESAVGEGTVVEVRVPFRGQGAEPGVDHAL